VALLPRRGSCPRQFERLAPAATKADQQVEVLGVGFAAEAALIMVRFKAPPKIAEQWWQGRVSVIDEATGKVYNEIPVTPLIGPLIGRPKIAGQSGYVMLVNAPPGIQPGSTVTVVLGNYQQEHVSCIESSDIRPIAECNRFVTPIEKKP
jgi:hypothetical protein